MQTARKLEDDESTCERKNILLTHITNIPGIRYRELLKLSGFSKWRYFLSFDRIGSSRSY